MFALPWYGYTMTNTMNSLKLELFLIDETFDPTVNNSYKYTAIFESVIKQHGRTKVHKVRVRIRRDSYAMQSYALAEVLTPGLTWTDLLTASTDEGDWYELLPYSVSSPAAYRSAREGMETLARELAGRAQAILV